MMVCRLIVIRSQVSTRMYNPDEERSKAKQTCGFEENEKFRPSQHFLRGQNAFNHLSPENFAASRDQVNHCRAEPVETSVH